MPDEEQDDTPSWFTPPWQPSPVPRQSQSRPLPPPGSLPPGPPPSPGPAQEPALSRGTRSDEDARNWAAVTRGGMPAGRHRAPAPVPDIPFDGARPIDVSAPPRNALPRRGAAYDGPRIPQRVAPRRPDSGALRRLRETSLMRSFIDTGAMRALRDSGAMRAMRDTGAMRAIKDTGAMRAVRNSRAMQAVRDSSAVRALASSAALRNLRDWHGRNGWMLVTAGIALAVVAAFAGLALAFTTTG